MAQGVYCANCGRQSEDGRQPRYCPDCGHAQGAGRHAISDWWYLTHFITGPVSGLIVWAKYRRVDRGSASTHLAISLAVTGVHAVATAIDYSIYGQCYDMIDGMLW